MHKVTREQIVALLDRRDQVGTLAVGRAIAAIYSRQTADEQQAGTTRHSNGRGFSAADAAFGTYLARWVQSKDPKTGRNRLLSGRFLDQGRELSHKYVGQLLEVAAEKAARDAEVAAIEAAAIRDFGGG